MIGSFLAIRPSICLFDLIVCAHHNAITVGVFLLNLIAISTRSRLHVTTMFALHLLVSELRLFDLFLSNLLAPDSPTIEPRQSSSEIQENTQVVKILMS